MNTVIKDMIMKYEIENQKDEVNALKQVLQEIILSGLAKGGFFKEAAFYGGTALGIFYGLGRFSEDLDFALLKPNKKFDLTKYFECVENELRIYGFNLVVGTKTKSNWTNIESAFVKGDTKEIILDCFPDDTLKTDGKMKETKIKFEVDIDPPAGAKYELQSKIAPLYHEVKLYDLPSLYAGKLHAVLARNWKTRTKGRDLYDFVFYVQKEIPVNMELLKNKLIASGNLKEDEKFDLAKLKKMLKNKFEQIDFEDAKKDVERFLKADSRELEPWSKEMFINITEFVKD